MERFQRRFGRLAFPVFLLWLAWEAVDAWGNVVFVTEGGRWDWLPETRAVTPVWRTVVALAALVIVVSYFYEWYVSRHPPEPEPQEDRNRSRTLTGGELTGRTRLELDSTADDLITDTKFSDEAYVKGLHRPSRRDSFRRSKSRKRKGKP